MRFILAFVIWVVFGSIAGASELTVILKTPTGQPVRDAVVTYKPAGGAGVKTGGHFEMVQENIQFHPFVLIVPVGADVNFPNHDKVRHHVYSFSPVKRFELKLYGHEQTRSVRFDKPGIVALGCNIHDAMLAYIDVVETPYFAKSDDNGRAVLSGAPEGQGQLIIWHPYQKSPLNEQSHPLALTSGSQAQSYVIDVRPAAQPTGVHANR